LSMTTSYTYSVNQSSDMDRYPAHTHRHTYRHRHIDVLREPVVRHGQVPCIQTHTDVQTDRQTDRHTDIQTHMQTYLTQLSHR